MKKELIWTLAIASFLLVFFGRFIGTVLFNFFSDFKENKKKNNFEDILKEKFLQFGQKRGASQNRPLRMESSEPLPKNKGKEDNKNVFRSLTHKILQESGKKINSHREISDIINSNSKPIQKFSKSLQGEFGIILTNLQVAKAINYLVSENIFVESISKGILYSLDKIRSIIVIKLFFDQLTLESTQGNGKILSVLSSRMNKPKPVISRALDLIYLINRGIKEDVALKKIAASKKTHSFISQMTENLKNKVSIKILRGHGREIISRSELLILLQKSVKKIEINNNEKQKQKNGQSEQKHNQRRKKSNSINKDSLNIKLDLAYKLLGLTQGCSKKELKKAYNKMALKFHPDIAGNIDDSTKIRKVVNLEFLKVRDAFELIEKHMK